MNTYEYIEIELNQLKNENLIKSFEIKELNSAKFNIITLEEKILEIEMSVNNCYKLNNHDRDIFENFEQLLKKYSLGYTIRFGDIITQKLNKFIETMDEDSS